MKYFVIMKNPKTHAEELFEAADEAKARAIADSWAKMYTQNVVYLAKCEEMYKAVAAVEKV